MHDDQAGPGGLLYRDRRGDPLPVGSLDDVVLELSRVAIADHRSLAMLGDDEVGDVGEATAKLGEVRVPKMVGDRVEVRHQGRPSSARAPVGPAAAVCRVAPGQATGRGPARRSAGRTARAAAGRSRSGHSASLAAPCRTRSWRSVLASPSHIRGAQLATASLTAGARARRRSSRRRAAWRARSPHRCRGSSPKIQPVSSCSIAP